MNDGDQAPRGRPVPVAVVIGRLADIVEATDAVAGVEAAAPLVAALVQAHVVADVVGITWRAGPRRIQRLAATDAVLLDLDRAGPVGPTAPWSPAPDDEAALTVDDTEADTRWQPWATAAAGLGLRSAAFVGLPPLRGGPVVLELYARRPAAFTTHLQPVLEAGRLTGLALRAADRMANLEDAMHTRGLIGQAQGILMQQYDLSGAEALAYLRRQSQESHRKIADLAAEVVRRREDRRADSPGSV